MIRTVLVPASGSSTDDAVFATALAAARPLAAHLEFYHVQLTAPEAAVYSPPADFYHDAALPVALNVLRAEECALSEAASAHVQSFCSRNSVSMRASPGKSNAVSASFVEEMDHARDRLLMHSRHSDLVVLGRPSHIDYLPSKLLEDLLLTCGRPILIAPDFPPVTLTGTVVVGWKETAEAARALGAAWPLLEKAHKVILLHIVEDEPSIPESLKHLAERIKWHGITAQIVVISSGHHALSYHLARTAADLKADLLVVGGFGHSRLRERVFGGVTQSLLEHANVPVLMMH
jgi:nucleotide-binding universal stress UspA family protein